jgi:ferredoxin
MMPSRLPRIARQGTAQAYRIVLSAGRRTSVSPEAADFSSLARPVAASVSCIIDDAHHAHAASAAQRRHRHRPTRPQCRHLARSSGPSDETPEDKAKTFVVGVGHDARVAQGVVDALSEGGLSGEALLATVRSMAGRWEVGEDEGLEALVASVKQDLALTEGKSMVRIWCVPPNAWSSGEEDEDEDENETTSNQEDRKAMMARAFPVEALDGTSITDVAKFGEGEGASTLGEYIECACSGIMACSTCHVVIDPEWIDRVGMPNEDEQDMLDLAYSPRKTSRLGCQVVITKDLDGLVVRLPKGANNLMDFVPFE